MYVIPRPLWLTPLLSTFPGACNPVVEVEVGGQTKTTEVKKNQLSPTWYIRGGVVLFFFVWVGLLLLMLVVSHAFKDSLASVLRYVPRHKGRAALL